MKIGILSDTHDRLESFMPAIEIFKQHQVGMLIHCGDWVSPFTLEYFDYICEDFRVPVKSVFGNNEGDIKRIIERNSQLKNPIEFASKITLDFEIENRKIAVFHGHDKTILDALVNSGMFDAVFSGHTHLPLQKTVNNTLWVNPGSLSHARQSRIINEASVAIYDSGQNTAEIITI